MDQGQAKDRVVNPRANKHHRQRQCQKRQWKGARQKDQEPKGFLAPKLKSRQRIARGRPKEN